jgi:hypothetical protein
MTRKIMDDAADEREASAPAERVTLRIPIHLSALSHALTSRPTSMATPVTGHLAALDTFRYLERVAITWNNDPMPGTTALDSTIVGQTGRVTLDVTAFVQSQITAGGDGIVSLALLDDTGAK